MFGDRSPIGHSIVSRRRNFDVTLHGVLPGLCTLDRRSTSLAMDSRRHGDELALVIDLDVADG